MNGRALPLWFRLGIAFDLLLAVLIGGFGTFVIWAMLPDGHPNPATVMVGYVVAYLVAPIVVVLGCGFAGARLLKLRQSILAAALVLAPVFFAPWLFIESLK